MHPDGKTVELNRNINGVETALTVKFGIFMPNFGDSIEPRNAE